MGIFYKWWVFFMGDGFFLWVVGFFMDGRVWMTSGRCIESYISIKKN